MIGFETFAVLYGEAKEYSNIHSYILERGRQMDHINENDTTQILTDIYDMSVNGINGIAKINSMGLSKLSRKFYIPLVTLQKWKYGERKPPEYTLLMISYITLIDKYFSKVSLNT